MEILVAPSILSADFSKLGEDVRVVEEAGADWIHVDVMDGHFVPNITIGMPVVRSLRKVTKLPFDVHLMIENADRYIDGFIDAGADIVTVHQEACPHLHRTVQMIKKRGVRAGVALNPATGIETLRYILPDIDMVLLMSVNPGFGGQSYIHTVTRKIAETRALCDSMGLSQMDIEVDGGVDAQTCREVTEAGANILVAGSAVYGALDKKAIISVLKGRNG